MYQQKFNSNAKTRTQFAQNFSSTTKEIKAHKSEERGRNCKKTKKNKTKSRHYHKVTLK